MSPSGDNREVLHDDGWQKEHIVMPSISPHSYHADSPYLVPFDGSFSLADSETAPPDNAPGKKECKKLLKEKIEELDDLQRMLYAQDKFSLLLVFQAMDAAGKDGTIRAVMSGVNPAGCQVTSFKKPSSNELDHDFLWRLRHFGDR